MRRIIGHSGLEAGRLSSRGNAVDPVRQFWQEMAAEIFVRPSVEKSRKTLTDKEKHAF
jgi:hypothetical protein